MAEINSTRPVTLFILLAYVLDLQCKELFRNVINSHMKVTLILLVLMLIAMVITVFGFIALIVKQSRKTTEAETSKRTKQSLAFANANHDIRGYLACIKGWIELSYNDVAPTSPFATNLKKIDDCANDLLALVNSILDFSKIEAGKMQLEEREFDLAQLLEDIADLHYPMAMKKGVELILDPCDGSIMNLSKVIGDQAKLKQILTNLLSNAVKFTSQGHISIRAKAKKLMPNPDQSSTIESKSNRSLLNQLCRLVSRNKRACHGVEETRSIKQDPSCMEFVFEIEDTGPGIPDDKRGSIFDNFVQVKENSAAGETGTGLGLSIVQSLVQLMGGDIEIVDRANDENGTCFRFNIFLKSPRACISQDTNLSSGPSTCARSSPATGCSSVVLLMKNAERRRMVRRYMKSLGINVVTLRQGNQLHGTLERIRSQLSTSQRKSCRLTATKSATEDILPMNNKGKSNLTGGSSEKCILLIIDANAGDFDRELSRSVAHFRKEISTTCVKVVWLDRNDTHRTHFHGLQEESLPPTDHIMLEPLHGSRLTRVLSLLPEHGGLLSDMIRRSMSTVSSINPQADLEELPSSQRERIVEDAINSHLEKTSTIDLLSQHLPNVDKKHSVAVLQRKSDVGTSSEKPLEGKRFLIAEDNPMQSKLAVTCVARWGADHTEVCANGKEAFEIVCKALSDLPGEGPSTFPFDYILMDCQMPVMDGMEATRRIREEESKCGIRTPIIALTAHATREEREKIAEAGMDDYLNKPLNIAQLLQVMKAPIS